MRKTVHPVSSNTWVTTGLICVFSECSHCTAPLICNCAPKKPSQPLSNLFSQTSVELVQWLFQTDASEQPMDVGSSLPRVSCRRLVTKWHLPEKHPLYSRHILHILFLTFQGIQTTLFILVKLFSCLQWRLFKNNKSERALHVFDAEHVSLAPAAAKLISKNCLSKWI